MGRRPRHVGLLTVLSLLLAATGNVLGNPVAGLVSDNLKRYAWTVFGLVTLAAIAGGIRLAQVQGGGVVRGRRREASVLIIVGGVLATADGVMSNVAAENLPPGFKPWSLLLLFVVAVGAIGIAVLFYHIQYAPQVEMTNRRYFLTRLATRYHQRREDALRGAVLIALGLHAEPEAVARPALTLDPLTGRQAMMEAEALPAGTGISQVYDTAGGNVLILGAPGAGKTTLLVELGPM